MKIPAQAELGRGTLRTAAAGGDFFISTRTSAALRICLTAFGGRANLLAHLHAGDRSLPATSKKGRQSYENYSKVQSGRGRRPVFAGDFRATQGSENHYPWSGGWRGARAVLALSS